MDSYNDETYWINNSINKIEEGSYVVDTTNQAYFGAPLYNKVNTVWLDWTGVDKWNYRILSIFFLIFTSIILYLILKPHVDKRYLLWYIGGFLILFETKLYFTTSTPVPIEMFFQSLLILFLLRFRLDNPKNLILTFIIVYLSILSKTTSIWLIGFVAVIYWYDNRDIIKTGLFSGIFILPYLIMNYIFMRIEPEAFKGYLDLVSYNISFNKETIKQIINPLYYAEKLYGYFLYPTSWLMIIVPTIALVKNKIKLDRTMIVLFTFITVLLISLIFTDQLKFPRRIVNLTTPIYLIFIILLDRNNWRDLFKHYIIINLIFHVIFINN
ncbi:MAG: hypothetical protein ACOCUI_00375 [bacterium]